MFKKLSAKLRKSSAGRTETLASMKETVKDSGLYALLTEHLTESELSMLCYDSGIDYEDLPGRNQAHKAKELLLYLDRRKRVSFTDDSFARLIAAGMANRPDLSWLEASGIEASRSELPETHRQGFNNVAIRNLLLGCFPAYNELDLFCHRHFPHARRSLNVALPLPDNAQALLGFCERRGRIQELLDIIAELHPGQFDQFGPYRVD